MKEAKRLGTFVLRYLKNSVGWIILLVFLVLEIGIFNQPYWATRNLQTEAAQVVAVGDGLHINKNGTATIISDKDKERSYVEIKSKHSIVYMRMEPSSAEKEDSVVRWKAFTRKDTDSVWFGGTKIFTYSPRVDRSRYWHLENDSNHVRILYVGEKGDTVPYGKFTVNPHVPFSLPILRVLAELLVSIMAIALRSRSRNYLHSLELKSVRTWAMLGTAFIIQIAVFVVWWLVCRGDKAATGSYVLNNGCTFDTDQYADMAKSLINGHVYMDLPVNKNLAAMHNPYDIGLRCSPQILNNGDKTPVYFDMAFYHGKYCQLFFSIFRSA